ncbi:autoinducer 2 ABC transporter substrate-binding protein [Kaistia algarum]|uniref:autoinducer 2 ABC transporter substrate-binding protein n=1 Tax=Kaistia algarum TaxID=2083279 RepID=UPI000CE72F43|nr:autoinducer 2 ABC transporter substrate-binding protein [Kaistia algarum]MCX5516562.1 autoinducer 2 ABC transporter substrate-binding protein [Kaistia algarum]PPE77501.1 autoinducer 2 ABC transporter substrate-binding protein [Kaistia algarum]
MFSSIKKVMAATAITVLATTAAFAADKPKVAFVPQLIGIPYFNAMEAGGNKAAADLGVDFIYTGPVDTNPVDQLQIVQNLINQGVNAISISVLDASSIAPVVKAAEAKGIKLFTSDSDAPDSGRAVYVAQATDEGLGGAIIDELVKRVGEDAKIGIVSGEATASNLNAWIGFMKKQAAAKYPKLQLLEPQYAGGTAERAAQLAGDLMTANPDMKAIIAVASSTCPGVAQAIETAGKIGSVIGTGYCSPNTARSYLKSGAFGFTVLWDPAQLGYLTVWAGKQLIDGKPFAASNTIPGFDAPVTYDAKTGILLLGPPAIFTAENVDKFDF